MLLCSVTFVVRGDGHEMAMKAVGYLAYLHKAARTKIPVIHLGSYKSSQMLAFLPASAVLGLYNQQ